MHTDKNAAEGQQRTDRSVLCTTQAAAYVGLSRSTLEKLRVRGSGPAYLKLGHAVRYRPPDLERWLSERVVTSTSDRRN